MQSAHALTPCGCIEENAKNRSSFGAWRHLFIATRDQLNIKISFAFASPFDSSKKSPLSLQIQTFKMNMVYLPNFFLASELLSLDYISNYHNKRLRKNCERQRTLQKVCFVGQIPPRRHVEYLCYCGRELTLHRDEKRKC